MSRSEAGALRAQIRTWRRGRADARLVDVLSDLYIAMFAAVMLGSIAVNVVLGIGRLSDDQCGSAACTGSRSLLPVLVVLAALTAVLTVARLLGPVSVSPAVGAWLVTSPVDRSSLVRPRLILMLVAATAGSVLLSAGGAVLGGWPSAPALTLVAVAGLAAAALVAGSARAQSVTAGPRTATTASIASWTPATALWVGLLSVAADATAGLSPPRAGRGLLVGVVVAVFVVAVLVILAASRNLHRLHRRDVARGGSLGPGLSGALSSLDLALAFDVVLEHRWRGHLPVRSRRARRGPRTGPAALVRCELARLSRHPRALLVLAGAVVVPYAVEGAGAGRVVLLVAPLVGFVAGVPLLTGLRVLERTSSLARLLPFTTPQTRGAAVAVPGICLLGFGLACLPALANALEAPVASVGVVGIACGASATAAAVRWMTGRPPDYSRPLVSTPAGAVPTNLYGSVLRGLDIWLLTAAPLLLGDPVFGAELSLAASALTLAVLLGRPERDSAA